jgi:2-keto-4-pentenoate hydratase/2-oxohepta-3-ene-1,7-dioic acid hydratase in catechol pathway
MIAAARGVLQLHGSAAAAVSGGFERLTRRPFPRLRPRPLWYERPLYYKGNPAAFIGDGDTVRWPAYAQALDYELEIGVVIARDCTDLAPGEALDAVGGFVLVNDFSARDVQFREMAEGLMGPAKSKDFGTALGPVVVTPPEFLPVLGALSVEVRVNGEVWGTGSTAGMRHSLADVVAYASAGEPLAAGTVIGLGTVAGCSGVEAGRWLSPGDVVELSAGPLGTLRNTVGEPEPWRLPGPADGTVYFSDSSTRFRIEHYKQDLLEHRPNGRVFRYRPPAAGLELVADGLYFPNGVALAPDESFLLVAQTGGYDILRIPLTGPAAGHPEPFAANLPGLPDNLSSAGDGSYWAAFPSPRLPLVDRMMPHPAARRVAARLPDRLQPGARRYGLVVRLDADGLITQSLHGPAGSYREIVGVRQHDGWLYLGSLYETAVGRVRIPAGSPPAGGTAGP